MTRFALITTTINVPTVLKKWAAAGMTKDDFIIVAGDQKSPHDEILDVLDEVHNTFGVRTKYVDPDSQHGWYSSDLIGWNCIQRRNIALLEALTHHPKYVITVDDDNEPKSEFFFDNVLHEFNTSARSVVCSSSGWYNPGVRCRPLVTHRGYPIDQRSGAAEYLTRSIREGPLGVFASLWTGAPDIDAIERIVNDPYVRRVIPGIETLGYGTWAPFNSQATVYCGDLAPLMYMWPGVGRYDDIWASYLARTVMDHVGAHVAYGHPIVHQNRNPHDLVKDMKAEMFGYEHTNEIVRILRDTVFTGDRTIHDYLRRCFENLTKHALFLPKQTTDGFAGWLADLEMIV